jgi:hypothetical protein
MVVRLQQTPVCWHNVRTSLMVAMFPWCAHGGATHGMIRVVFEELHATSDVER